MSERNLLIKLLDCTVWYAFQIYFTADVCPLSADRNYTQATMLPILFNCLVDYCDLEKNFQSKYM